MARTVLVTGAAGFVGAVLGRRLLEDGHAVHLVVRPGGDEWRLDGLDTPLHALDLAGDGVESLVHSVRPDWIFHLAAYGGYAAHRSWRRMVDANVVGTMNLVEAAARVGVDACVNAGSSSEYGLVDHPAREDDAPVPNSHYAVTKLSQTLYCRFAARQYDLHLPTLRLYSVYGPYESPGRFIPQLIAAGREGRLPPLVSPDTARDFVYSDDVVEAFLAAATQTEIPRGAIYNVGTGRQTTIRDAVGVARETFGIAQEPVWGSMANRAWDTTCWVADPASIQRDLGWRATVDFDTGFRRCAAWT